jgi:Holliday junction DNA helicase RuvA
MLGLNGLVGALLRVIVAITGTLVEKGLNTPKGPYLHLSWNGLVFEALSSERSVLAAPAVGQDCQLFTHWVFRENDVSVVGFVSREERDLFATLQTASGVGVKVSLALLSTLTVSEIVQAVVAGQYKVLTAAKGVGPKLAQKIILDLKEKLKDWRAVASPQADSGLSVPDTEPYLEAESVLLSLGYSREEALRALSAAPTPDAPSETLLRDALRWLSQQA